MAIKHARQIVGTTPVDLSAAIPGATLRPGLASRTISVQNGGTADVLLGGADVSSTNFGYTLPVGQAVSLDCGWGDRIFAVVASGTQTVNVLVLGA